MLLVAGKASPTALADVAGERRSKLLDDPFHRGEGPCRGVVRHDDAAPQRPRRGAQRSHVRARAHGGDVGNRMAECLEHEDIVDVGGEDRVAGSRVELQLFREVVDPTRIGSDTLLNDAVHPMRTVTYLFGQIREQRGEPARARATCVQRDEGTSVTPQVGYPVTFQVSILPNDSRCILAKRRTYT